MTTPVSELLRAAREKVAIRLPSQPEVARYLRNEASYGLNECERAIAVRAAENAVFWMIGNVAVNNPHIAWTHDAAIAAEESK